MCIRNSLCEYQKEALYISEITFVNIKKRFCIYEIAFVNNKNRLCMYQKEAFYISESGFLYIKLRLHLHEKKLCICQNV